MSTSMKFTPHTQQHQYIFNPGTRIRFFSMGVKLAGGPVLPYSYLSSPPFPLEVGPIKSS